jgi:spermidine synthase
MDSVTSTAMKMRGKVSPAVFRAVIYIVAFVTRDRDEFRNTRLALSQPLFRQRSDDRNARHNALAWCCRHRLRTVLVRARSRASGKKGVRSTTGLVVFAILAVASNRGCADDLIDENVRAQMLKHSDGRVAHLETEYNDLFIDKHGSLLGLSCRYKGRPEYIESIIDLKDPDAMPVPYNRIMPVALAYPQETKRILMIGLGAGSISTYLGRAMPDAQIDVVELDPGVIAAGKKYFGLRETDKLRFIESDGRVYLNRHKDAYDLILLDAFRELGVPFHMLTREFYALVKEHLAPGGAVASNVAANTKLYLSTLVTLHTVFPTVDAYPAWSEPNETQAIAVAVSAPRPAAESLMQRALALQTEYHFRYPLPALIGKRVTELYSKGADVLTDDFAPADLYRVTPIGVPKRKAAR